MTVPTVCVVYVSGDAPGEFEHGARSWRALREYSWVTRAITLVTTEDVELSSTADRERRHFAYHKNFGRGWDRQPEEGGFDEVAARNYALQLGRETGCDWLLLVDNDELFTEETIRDLTIAHSQDKDFIWFACYHFWKPGEYFWWPNTVKRVHNVSRPLHDPHPRAMRNRHPWQYILNPQLHDKQANRTMHCRLASHKRERALYVGELRHIHTHHMFDPKRPPVAAMQAWERRTASFVLPDHYVEAWSKQEHNG